MKSDVYKVAAEMLHLENSEDGSKASKGIAAAVIGAISGCVSPIVYVLTACGLLQGALIIATALYPDVVANTTFQVLTYMSWTPFTYLPVLIALAGSLAASFFGTLYYAYAGLAGLLTVPNAYNVANTTSLTGAAVGTAIALVGAFALVQLVGFEEKVEEPVPEEKEALPALPFELASPIKGEVKPLSACKDLAFASGAMGKGVVIEPTEGKVYAPCDGQVMMLFETLHAIGLKSENGAELLIHVGLDTVKLNGQGFKAYVQGGDSVKKGDLLIEFDIDFIKEKGLSVATPMVITNADNYVDFISSTGNHLSGDKVLDIIPA